MATYGPFSAGAVATDGYSNPDNARQVGGGEATYSGSAGDGRELHASGFGSIVPVGQRLTQITIAANVTSFSASGQTQPAIDSLHIEKGQGNLLADPELHGAGIGVAEHEATIYGLDLSADDVNASDFGVGFIFYDSMGETANGSFSLGVDVLYIKEIVCE